MGVGAGQALQPPGAKALADAIKADAKILDDDAPATVTRVTAPALGAYEVAVPTPPIAAGTSAMLPPVDMLNCLSPACSFIIRVDSDGAVPEASETNNESTGACPP